MSYDWRDQTITHRVRVMMVSQTNLNDGWGELEGVDLSKSSIDANYYTDTRYSGKLHVVGEGWRRGSFIRIVHEVPEWGYSNILGTFIVTDDKASEENGVWHYDLELHSTLKALEKDLLATPWTVAKGSSALHCTKQALTSSGLHSMRKVLGSFSNVYDATVEVDDSLAEDVRATTAQILQAGKSRLECLFAFASMCNNRIDVMPYGYIKVEKYVSPAAKQPKWRFDLSDPSGIVEEGSLSRSSDWLTMADTVAVVHRYTETSGSDSSSKSEQREVYATAKVASDAHHSTSKRGYTITDFREIKSMSPKTATRAQEIARGYLAEDVEQVEWDLKCSYVPLWEGDVVELYVHDGDPTYRGVRKCLVKDVTIDLQYMHMSLTLKETASGDKE